MNATEISPSQSIENSLLNYNNNASASAASAFAQSPSHYTVQQSVNGSQSPQHAPIPTSTDEHTMEHESTPPPDPLEAPSPPDEEDGVPMTEGQNHDRMVLDTDGVPETHPPPETSSWTPGSPSFHHPAELTSITFNAPISHQPLPLPNVLVAVQSDPDNAVVNSVLAESMGDHAETVARERSATRSVTENTQDDDEDSDDDSYDGHIEFLRQFKEDTTKPSDDEMQEIEASNEKSALDHGIWEKAVYTALDDPEYTIGESGCINWTLQGFHGTRENPNKQRIMKSPIVRIGGYKWNIKVFPHGNEGTDQISVYVECTGEPSGTAFDENHEHMQVTPTQEVTDPNSSAAESRDTSEEASTDSSSDPTKPWEVAAQIGCVMYNPREPRVHVFERATHHFENASHDWGWVRFHGPWNTIHQRRHLQRESMLRDDALAFTVYIRTIRDPTRALWWHQVDQMHWDSVAKTGYRGLTAEEPASNAIVAAFAPWLHLTPFKRLILDTPVPSTVLEPRQRVRPFFKELQELLYAKYAPSNSSVAATLYQVQHVFDWYEHQFVGGSDVIEVWESIRNLLNTEYWNSTTEEPQYDVLRAFKTIRQNWHPVFPASAKTEPNARELRSVQDVLNHASQEGQKGYKDWEGCNLSSDNVPEVLQVELHRQQYDVSARKWKRLTHRIKMNEIITFARTQYTLYGMIIQKGDLGSGRFYTIVRPGGQESRWVRYKSGHATYLTHRQAVESHEGRGNVREGTESIAYIVLYVRSNDFKNIAPVAQPQFESNVIGSLKKPKQCSAKDLAKVGSLPVVIHDSAAFTHHSGVGFVDPWTRSNRDLYELALPTSANLQDVQREVVSKLKIADRPEQCRLWPLKTTTSTLQYAPRLETLPLQTKLLDFADQLGGLHLWLSVIPLDSIVPGEPLADEALPPPPPPPAVPHVSSLPEAEPPPPPAGSSAESSLELPSSPAQATETGDDADVVMGGTQEQLIEEPPISVPPRLAETSVKTPQWQKGSDLYFFVKRFDPVAQTLSGIGAFFANPTERVHDSLSKLGLHPESNKLYFEAESLLDEQIPSADSTFSALGYVNSGFILTLSDNRIPESDLNAMKQRGEAPTAPEYYQSLTFTSHFAYQGNLQVESYFGGPYTCASLRNGRSYGDCIMIDDTTGDAYVGKCVAGMKSGHGTMYYANGDTYTGQWASSQPEGEGIMVYNTTGNKYEGGWKAGRRHGKGVMNFEVADEEMQLCRICYEAEMDALFYRCGHVAACEQCARQVKECPVCRRTVDAVVRVWRT